MNVNFEYYRIFYSVANHGNITKAAKELMISQPAISKSKAGILSPAIFFKLP